MKTEEEKKNKVITISRQLFDVDFPIKSKEDELKMQKLLDDLNDALCDLDGVYD